MIWRRLDDAEHHPPFGIDVIVADRRRPVPTYCIAFRQLTGGGGWRWHSESVPDWGFEDNEMFALIEPPNAEENPSA